GIRRDQSLIFSKKGGILVVSSGLVGSGLAPVSHPIPSAYVAIIPKKSGEHPGKGYLLESLPDRAPIQPESIETVLKDVHRNTIPGITHWESPNFFAHFASSGSTASFVGEMLMNGFSVVGFNWESSPAATELEIVVMEWLSKLLQLPKSFSFSSDSGGGVLHSTTCEALVCTLLAAKEKILDQIGRDNVEKLVVYCSDQTHFSFQKSVKIVGINPKNIRHVLTSKSTNFQLTPQSLDEMIRRDVEVGLVPLYLCATVGTTSTTAVQLPVDNSDCINKAKNKSIIIVSIG
ncbi:tyrosine decarboxylase 1-like protein, partial [Tanacetum coccineum]